MRRYKIVILAIITVLISRGCKDSPVNVQDTNPVFIANVVDSHNNPLADVGFHYIFYFGRNIASREYLIDYQLQSADSIAIKLSDSFGNVVGSISKEYQLAGHHSIRFYASFFSNGIYYCTISGTTINERQKFFVRTDNVTELIQTFPLAKTNANGILEIPYSVFGIGDHLTFQSDSTQVQLIVNDSIRVVLFKPGYQFFVKDIKLDTTRTFQATFQLQSN